MMPLRSGFRVEEVAAPPGWSALLFKQQLPVEDEEDLLAYREAVADLMARLPAFAEVHPEEVLLLFERLRPGKEVQSLQSNARGWLPEFGVGIWLDQKPPTTWTEDEFADAAPGTLRPVIERVVRIQRDPTAQLSAWRTLLGSGALIRVSCSTSDAFVKGATDLLQSSISDISLTSFPFYVPLLRPATLHTPASSYDLPLADQLPGADAYVRESVEDGGLFMLVRQPPKMFWKHVLRTPLDMEVAHITPYAS